MDRSKLVAIITGAISIILAIAYLILVQLLDYRDMKPAPISQFDQTPAIISVFSQVDKITET
ncbi:hypothetical protein COO91_00482 [Nostoc flagelliforme CCNUN1]|uniref:Glucose-inhibited division protein A n=1 Tax=Nostoc flagelliforme CCNUN1 TaxID=2038116 RepID=A0A2K8SHA5_9NOSO|nr:hypothetical protein [Nostoc flagelliforme]AUB34653.1 hypothetical protein COO91_00482 [Nostoc flagelliforme CCNUN1]